MIKIISKSKNKIIILAVLTVFLIILSFFTKAPYLFALLTLIIALDSENILKKTFNCIKTLQFKSSLLRGLAIVFLYFYSFALTLFPELSEGVSRPYVFIGLAIIILILEFLRFYKTKIKYESILDNLKYINNEYKLGETIEIKSGELIQADGVIIEGETLINEQTFTDKDSLIEKKVNDEILGGTFNVKNRIVIKITQTGEDAVVNKIRNLLNNPDNEYSKSQNILKNTENYLGIIFLILSIGVFILWFRLTGSIYISIFSMCSILLIVAPENFYNSIDLPLKFGIKKASKKGVFIKNYKIMDILNKINRIILKKRKIITEDELKVTNVIPKEAFNEKRFLILAGSLESLDISPVAQTICDYCENENITFKKVNDYKIIKGMGVIGIMDDQEFIMGNEKLMQRYKVKMIDDLYTKAEVMARNLRTPVFVARNRSLIGVIGITDKLKNNVKNHINHLKKTYNISLITGDNQILTKRICEEMGIKNFIADLDEFEKLQAIKNYREKNEIVLSIGDGKEDKDILDESDIGLSLGAYSDLSTKTNDITVLTDDISNVDCLLKTTKNIKNCSKKNLQITVLYHLIVLILAIGLFLPYMNLLIHPAGAALLMFISFMLIEKNSFASFQDKSDYLYPR